MDPVGIEPTSPALQAGASTISATSPSQTANATEGLRSLNLSLDRRALWPIELTIRGAPGRNRTGTTFGHRVLSAARLAISPQAQVVWWAGEVRSEKLPKIVQVVRPVGVEPTRHEDTAF